MLNKIYNTNNYNWLLWFAATIGECQQQAAQSTLRFGLGERVYRWRRMGASVTTARECW